MNLRLVIVDTGTSKCSKATISSAETILPLMLRHWIVLSLNAFASISISSIIMRLLEISKSFNVCPSFFMTSHSFLADKPDSLVSDKWHTLIVFDS